MSQGSGIRFGAAAVEPSHMEGNEREEGGSTGRSDTSGDGHDEDMSDVGNGGELREGGEEEEQREDDRGRAMEEGSDVNEGGSSVDEHGSGDEEGSSVDVSSSDENESSNDDNGSSDDEDGKESGDDSEPTEEAPVVEDDAGEDEETREDAGVDHGPDMDEFDLLMDAQNPAVGPIADDQTMLWRPMRYGERRDRARENRRAFILSRRRRTLMEQTAWEELLVEGREESLLEGREEAEESIRDPEQLFLHAFVSSRLFPAGMSSLRNEGMIEELKRREFLRTDQVERAFRVCPREHFVPPSQISCWYNSPSMRIRLPDYGFTISASEVYASALEVLKFEAGNRFLDVGSGCGQLTAMGALMCGKSGSAVGIDLVEGTIEFGRANVDKLKLVQPEYAANACDIEFFVMNAFLLDTDDLVPEGVDGRFDRIHVGATCPSERLDELAALLRPGGRLVTPCGERMLLLKKLEDGSVQRIRVAAVRYHDLIIPSDAEITLNKYRRAVAKSVRQPPSESTFEADFAKCGGSSDVSHLLGNKEGSDFSILVHERDQEVRIPAHKRVLIARADHFRAVFASRMRDRNMAETSLPEEFSKEVLQECLRYMYTDDANVEPENCVDLLKLCRFYGMSSGLVRKCEDVVLAHIDVDNAVFVLQMGNLYACSSLKKGAIHFVLNNLTAVRASSEWQELSRELVADVLLEALDRYSILRGLLEKWPRGVINGPDRASSISASECDYNFFEIPSTFEEDCKGENLSPDHLREMFLGGSGHDFALAVRDDCGSVHRIPSHKKVLAARMGYFRTILSQNKDAREITEVDIPTVSRHTLMTCLRYAYTDEVRVNDENCIELLKAGLLLDLSGHFLGKCKRVLYNKMNEANAGDALLLTGLLLTSLCTCRTRPDSTGSGTLADGLRRTDIHNVRAYPRTVRPMRESDAAVRMDSCCTWHVLAQKAMTYTVENFEKIPASSDWRNKVDRVLVEDVLLAVLDRLTHEINGLETLLQNSS